ncbi:MAG: ankyrin repeat domain-containing protein [Rickettsiaceae bacterium]|nr:ankyrin repeat domain-containing protein [Rickettsiaceae bacterium]
MSNKSKAYLVAASDDLVQELHQLGLDIEKFPKFREEVGENAKPYIDCGSYEVVSFMLSKGYDPNHEIHYKIDLLYASIIGNHIDSVQMLTDQGANVNGKYYGCFSYLSCSIAEGHNLIAKLLINKGALIDFEPESNEVPPFSTAILSRNMEMIEFIAKTGYDLDKLIFGLPPIETAIARNFPQIVAQLIDLGASLNKPLPLDPPIFTAIRLQRKEILDLMIKRGANVEALNHNKFTPLLCAIAESNEEIVSCLIKHKANVNGTCANKISPLYAAISGGSEEIVSSLLDAGANPNYVIDRQYSPLWLAVNRKSVHMLHELLSHGANPNLVKISEFHPAFCADKALRDDPTQLVYYLMICQLNFYKSDSSFLRENHDFYTSFIRELEFKTAPETLLHYKGHDVHALNCRLDSDIVDKMMDIVCCSGEHSHADDLEV